nr:MAG TPA: hypothetical protein [Caudoviricetes sp.]
MDGKLALIILVAIVLIVSLEFYDWINPVGACDEARRMCEYTIVVQAALTVFLIIVHCLVERIDYVRNRRARQSTDIH